jgi:6-phosphofructo-2-kinase/fructose-2,6-biphosphatase
MMRLQVYEPVTEGSYIKMIDKVSGEGGHMQVKTIGFDKS